MKTPTVEELIYMDALLWNLEESILINQPNHSVEPAAGGD